MKKATISEIRDSYREAKKDKDSVIHRVVDRETSAIGQNVEIFTDGSSKGVRQTIDNRSFAGWGWVKKQKDHDNNASKTYRYGGLINATSNEAELIAIAEALRSIDQPSNVSLFTDSVDSVEMLRSRAASEEVISNFKIVHDKIGASRISNDMWLGYRNAKSAMAVFEVIDENENILTLDTEWIRSHVLEDLGAQSVDFSTCTTQEEFRLANKVMGNYEADYVANKGAIKSMVSSMIHFSKNTVNEHRARDLISLIKKNVNSSAFAREVLTGFLSKTGIARYKEEMILDTFGMDFVRTAAEARELYLSGDKGAYDAFMQERMGDQSQKYVGQLKFNDDDKPLVEMVNITQTSREDRKDRMARFKNKYSGFDLNV